MFSRLLRFAIPIAIALAFAPIAARANQTGGTTYCNPPNVFQDGTTWYAAPLNADLSHAEQCGGQYGDFFSDGPLINPAPTYSGSSLQFTIPAETWIAIGQRIPIGAILETAPAATTSYWWLSTATNQYSYTLSNSPPDAYSVLEYTIVSNGTGITGVTNPTLAGETLQGTLALPALANGCVQIASGVLTSTGLGCGSGSGAIAAVASGTNIIVNTVSGTATVNLNASPAITGTPSISSSSTAGTLDFGSDATAALARTGTNTFTFTATAGSGVASVVAAGGFQSSSSTYGPTSATVNGPLLAATVAGSGLTPGQCVQTTSGGVLTTTGSACGPGTALSNVLAGANIGVSVSSNVATISAVNSPAYNGSVTAGNSTAYIPSVSDLSASDSTSSGGLDLGGTSSHCRIDYGDTTVGTLTIGCPLASSIAVSSISVPNYVVAGNTTAYIPTGPHLSASSSTTSGGLDLGGTSSHCLFDFGITTASWFNVGCQEKITGALTSSSYIEAGNATAPTSGVNAGDLVASRSVSTGQLWLGGSSQDCTLDYNITHTLAMTSSCSIQSANNLAAIGDVVSGHATFYVPPSSEMSSSDSTTSGGIYLGGSLGECEIDYGITAASKVTVSSVIQPCPVQVADGSILASYSSTLANAPTLAAGDLGGSESATAGKLVLGGSSSACTIDFGVTTASALTTGCNATVDGELTSAVSGSSGELKLGGTSSNCLEDYGVTEANTVNFDCNLWTSVGFSATDAVEAGGAVVAGQFNGIPSTIVGGDLVSTRGVTSGRLVLGGNNAFHCCAYLDYGITTPDALTLNGATAFNLSIASFSASSSSGSIPSAIAAGDISASEGASSGKACLGGSSTADCFDFGITASNTETHPVDVQIAGAWLLSSYSSTGANAPTLAAGDIGASEGASSGKLVLGGSSTADSIDFAITTLGVETHSKPVAAPKLLQNASNDFGGTCTNSSSTTCAATITVAYSSTPICIAQDTSSTNQVQATCSVSGTTVTVTVAPTVISGTCATSSTTCTITAPYAFSTNVCTVSPASSATEPESWCAISSTTITVTAASSGTNTYGVILKGLPTATGHTFSYILLGNPN